MANLELYKAFKEHVDQAANQVVRDIMYLLDPAGGYMRCEEAVIAGHYTTWKAESRAMDIALSLQHYPAGLLAPMPIDEACQRMWAVEISRRVQGEFATERYIPGAVAAVLEARKTNISSHSDCACIVSDSAWSFKNQVAMLNPLFAPPRMVVAAGTRGAISGVDKYMEDAWIAESRKAKCPHGLPYYACMPCSH